jgi:AsmA-like C-terminal region
MRRVLLWTVLAAAAAFAGIVALALVQVRPVSLRERITVALANRLNADVEIKTLEVNYLPRLRVNGAGVTLRVKNRPELPPFISIARFSMDLGLLSITRRHVDTIHVDGLTIQVPPKDARGTIGSSDTDSSEMERLLEPSKIIVEHLITHDAELSFVKSKPGRRPLVFPIRELHLDRLGFDRMVLFRAVLVNPVPTGLVDAQGTFGPWIKEDPAETAVQGSYVFSNADLSTIDGIHGILTSTGSFSGRITAIDVNGTTSTPDFNLSLGGRSLPLSTTFVAMVDGTNGTTMLRKVDGKLRDTSIVASGAVTNLPGPGMHVIDLDVNIPKGRIEDLLALVTNSPQPLATGAMTLHSSVHLPPGRTSVARRLRLDGQFGLSRTRFKGGIQERVQEFSRRTQDKEPDEVVTNVATNVHGQFRLSGGVMHMTNLTFDVPGATVTLDGTCDLRDKALALQGRLRMDASVSKAVGGFKSIFLRLIDPFFRKPGQGTVLPIKIQGTLDAPKMGLNFRGK